MFLRSLNNKIKNFIQSSEYSPEIDSHYKSMMIVSSCNCDLITQSCDTCNYSYTMTVKSILEYSSQIDNKYALIGFIRVVDYCCENPHITKQNKQLMNAIYQTIQHINSHSNQLVESLRELYNNIDLKSDWDLFH